MKAVITHSVSSCCYFCRSVFRIHVYSCAAVNLQQTAFLLHHMHWRIAWHSPVELHNSPIGHFVPLTFLAGMTRKKKKRLAFDLFMWHFFERISTRNVTSSGVPVKETNVRIISAKVQDIFSVGHMAVSENLCRLSLHN